MGLFKRNITEGYYEGGKKPRKPKTEKKKIKAISRQHK